MNNASVIREAKPGDAARIAYIIRTVMAEFGADGKGFAIHDEEVDDIPGVYSQKGWQYFVLQTDGVVTGGGGVAPLLGGPPDVCELKKMYMLKESRGVGLGSQLLKRCLAAARDFGYMKCYLETFHTMKHAMVLYEKKGFSPLPGPMGATGHFGCDHFYILDLQSL